MPVGDYQFGVQDARCPDPVPDIHLTGERDERRRCLSRLFEQEIHSYASSDRSSYLGNDVPSTMRGEADDQQ